VVNHETDRRKAMKKLMFALLVLVMMAVASGAATANASQVDMLIKKLVEKGILSATEAEALVSEMQKEEATAEGEKGKMPSIPKWVEKIDFKGDFRLRYQREETDNSNQPSRSRGRYRLRAGVVADVTDQWDAGFGICSGGANPRSTLQSFDNGFETPDLRLDYAFATYKPWKFASITGGKFKNPIWQPNVFLWDSDIRPEGGAAQLKYKLDKGKGIEVFATPAFFVLEEFAGQTDDPIMWTIQAGGKFNLTDRIYLKVAGAYYGTDNVKGNSFTYSAGTNSTNAAGKLIYGYDTITADLEAGFTLPGPVPFFAITGTYVRNTSADDDTDGDGFDDNQGWLAGFKCGHSKLDKFGRWQFIYNYRRLERDAWLDILPHSSFYNGSTNVKGHEFAFKFGLHKNIDLTADYYKAEQIRLNPDNLEREQNWLAVDLNLKW
jgi:polyhydroxyalkanoate synthesis regulator phasin